MPPGSHQPLFTPSKPVGSDLLHGSLPLHVSLLLLNGCCPLGSLAQEPFILVGSSYLSLCSLHLHVTLQFLAREYEVTCLLAIVAKPLSTLSTLAVPSASAISLRCSMVCNPYAIALHCTKIHWLRAIACSFAMGSCHKLYYKCCTCKCAWISNQYLCAHRWV